MRYLVKIKSETATGGYQRNTSFVQLESKAELTELVHILPENMSILSVECKCIYDTLVDFKAELLKNRHSDLEMGKISQGA